MNSSQSVHEINRDLFGENHLPLAAYVDGGWPQLERFRSPQFSHYEQFCPKALAGAYSQYRSIGNPLRWGQNRATASGATWTTVTKNGVCIGAGGRQFPGKAISEKEILRALTRPNVFGVGRCDAEVNIADLPYARWNPTQWPEEVSCLILDIDMDVAWATKDAAAVRREVWIEGEAARLFGLHCHWLKTGGRGHQMILPLPHPVSRSAASWLARVMANLLTQVQETGQAVCDSTNVDGVVRLAGGRHAKTGDLSLFFEPETLDIYPVQDQLSLLSAAYRWQDCPSEKKAAFSADMTAVSNYLHKEHGIAAGETVERTQQGSDLAWDTAIALDDNCFVGNVRDAYERLLGTAWGPSRDRGVAITKTVGEVHRGSGASSGMLARAVEIWTAGYLPGASWEWFVRGDGKGKGNGIWAAFVLFGDNGAENELRRQATRIAAVSAAAMRERQDAIRSLCRNHYMKRQTEGTSYCSDVGRSLGLQAQSMESLNVPREPKTYQDASNLITGVLTDDLKEIVENIMKKLAAERQRRETGRKARFQERQLQILRKLVSVLVLGFSQTAYITISRRTLAASILGLWPEDEAVNHNTLQNNLAFLTEDSAECLFPLLRQAPLTMSYMTLRGPADEIVDGPNAVTRYVVGADVEIPTLHI